LKIKKYLVHTMSEAVLRIKQELGSEAVIIHSRKVRQPGWKGLLGNKLWEVTAALDQVSPASVPVSPDILVQQGALRRDISEIKKTLYQLSLASKTQFSDPAVLSGRVSDPWRQVLYEKGIETELVEELLGDITWDLKTDEKTMMSLMCDKIKALLEQSCQVPSKGKVIVLVGPTGVGKTTTIAKLAARLSLMDKKDIGLITIDTYRIGAVEQLRIYGDIIGIPVSVVMTPSELLAAVNGMCGKELILIDTAGRSYKNTMHISQLKGFLDRIPQADIYLVLSSTSKSNDLRKSVDHFQKLSFNRLIFTKIDETDCLGDILNISLYAKVPIAYVTNGQNVPDDIRVMHPGRLAKLVLGGQMEDGPGW